MVSKGLSSAPSVRPILRPDGWRLPLCLTNSRIVSRGAYTDNRAMGFKYLDGKRWSQVTRDERFFCQRLYQLICDESAEAFVRYLCEAHALDVEATGEWEAGFEVCFYRDLWQLRGRQEKPFSRKRTFDLCLFGEKAIMIIEAKAAVGFERAQVEEFGHDIVEVQRLTGVEKVHLVELCSSQYQVEPAHTASFTEPILRWTELAVRYGDDPVLLRADAVYEPGRAFDRYR